MNRRDFLQLMGIAGAATSLGVNRALAQTAAPRRLLVVSHCHGWPYDSWKLRPEGFDVARPGSLDLAALPPEAWSPTLAPLFEHRRRLLAIDGLSLMTAELDTDGNRHDTGWVHAWTGGRADFSSTDTRARSASLDQLVAAQIARPDRLPSLELSVDDAAENGRPIAYAPNGARLPVESAPDKVWQRLFGPAQAPDPLATRRKAVIDFAHGEYTALAPRLGQAQRTRLTAHFDLLAGVSQRLEGMASLSCGDISEQPGAQPSYDQRFDVFADLVTAAFACDVTRVATLSLGELPTADFGWDHLTDDVHKGLAHGIYDDPEKHQAMTDYLAMHAGQVARLVAKLQAMPDIDGRSVMDNTLIVWGSELADGWHGYQHYCPVVIGGDWAFRSGRYLYWPHATPAQMLTRSGYSAVSGLPHQHLLVSVARAMGVETDRVGIEHVQSQGGQFIDCKGPLPEMS